MSREEAYQPIYDERMQLENESIRCAASKRDLELALTRIGRSEIRSQELQYLDHALKKFGETRTVLAATREALKKMIAEEPHDYEFMAHEIDDVPSFGLKRLDALVEEQLALTVSSEESSRKKSSKGICLSRRSSHIAVRQPFRRPPRRQASHFRQSNR